MIEWLSSKMTTSVTVLVIAASFTGLFSMQAEHYRTLELEDLADAITDLVTEVDLLACEAEVQVNWTSSATSHGLPRDFHGEHYLVQFTTERPYVVWQGTRVAGRFFPSDLVLLDGEDAPVVLLEVPSTTGFILDSELAWRDWGLDQVLTVRPVP